MYTKYYNNGQLAIIYNYVNGIQEGEYKTYHTR
jgi:antitoxin component YwqK of YwqJK toxin-antitoxin module